MTTPYSLTFGEDPSYSEPRLRELILYVCKKCEDDPTFCEEKLKSILFFCDFGAYRKFGKSITGSAYMKEADLPCPAP